ncbi:MAG: lytic transglycosylase domain-containing protein [Rhodospirillales bacterium]|nr:lytic transglycosylase domain-containing protein [Rhodospirillales bacterium]
MPVRIPTRQRLTVVIVFILTVLALPAATKAKKTPSAPERTAVKSLIRAEALRMGVPVSLALAVAHTESYFNPRAVSSAGARGGMQIMPATSKGEYGIHPKLLWVPRVNIRIGLHFLKRLLKRYRGRAELALSYYNGGSAVGDLPNARIIPATAKYVRKVLRLQRKYRADRGRGDTRTWTASRRRNLLSRKARAVN